MPDAWPVPVVTATRDAKLARVVAEAIEDSHETLPDGWPRHNMDSCDAAYEARWHDHWRPSIEKGPEDA